MIHLNNNDIISFSSYSVHNVFWNEAGKILANIQWNGLEPYIKDKSKFKVFNSIFMTNIQRISRMIKDNDDEIKL